MVAVFGVLRAGIARLGSLNGIRPGVGDFGHRVQGRRARFGSFKISQRGLRFSLQNCSDLPEPAVRRVTDSPGGELLCARSPVGLEGALRDG